MGKTRFFKMCKKITALAAAAVMAVTFVGCENKNENPPDDSQVAEYIEKKVDKISKDSTIDENVIYDKDNIKITSTSIEFKWSQMYLNLTIENNTSQDLRFITGSTLYNCNSINGYMVDDGYSICDVAAGQKNDDAIIFDLENLVLYGIDEIATIEIGFTILDDNNNSKHTGPLLIKTSAYDTNQLYNFGRDSYQKTIKNRSSQKGFGYTLDYFSDDTIYQNSDISIISEALLTKGNKKYLFLEAENNGNNVVNFRVQDFFINGLMVKGGSWSADNISPGKKYISMLSLTDIADGNLERYGIDDIGNIELDVELLDNDYNTISNAQTITITASKKYLYDSSGDEIYNKNNIRIVSKGIAESDSIYNNDMEILWLVENNSSTIINIRESGESSSINGLMVDTSFYGEYIPAGKAAIVSIHLYDMDLNDINITSADEIEEFEMAIKIKDKDYNDIDETTVKVTY